ncbi:Uncharacterized protein Fot_35243 [Forsythia ovata]|uniref:Uncharacterized protein n=1 Tax=Forsythia ovata TaxID=205694 RepID=A0ABD1SKZ0_9LAMI
MICIAEVSLSAIIIITESLSDIEVIQHETFAGLFSSLNHVSSTPNSSSHPAQVNPFMVKFVLSLRHSIEHISTLRNSPVAYNHQHYKKHPAAHHFKSSSYTKNENSNWH